MIITLSELLEQMEPLGDKNDTKASDALWIRFSPEKAHKTVEYRTATQNEMVHVYLDKNDALVGIEIFP